MQTLRSGKGNPGNVPLKAVVCLAVLILNAFGPPVLTALAEVSVEATLSHLSFPQDKAARLTITVSGTRKNAEIELPQIDNIRLQNRGRSSQISMINGAISSSVSHNYLVQAVKAGSYTIPSLKVTAGGKTYATKPLAFQVTQAGPQPNGYRGRTDQAAGEVAFLRISEKSSSHYSGEIVPLTIKAYFTQAYRADINSLPTLNGDGVVMSQLQDKPQQTEESISGRKYHVLSWDTSLSGIKVGEHPVHFSLEATLLIPQKRRSRSPFGGNSFFDDPFFNDSALDNIFGSHQRKPIVSVSPEFVFTVLPLPTDDRPDNFTGAIGDFELKVAANPVNVEVGEPMTLTMEISGTGNFDRVEAPVFPESPDWKTYTPTSDFSEAGRNFSGTKIFEQAVVARSAAVNGIPPLSFSYFDPRQKRYITKTSETVAIGLKQPAIPVARQPAQVIQQPQQTQQSSTARLTSTPAISGLAPIHLETGSFHGHIEPLIKNFWLLTVCALCLLVLLILFVHRMRQRNLEKHPEIELQRHKKLLLESDLEKVENTKKTGDCAAFLSLGRTAIQNQLGLSWNIEPAALSLADIRTRLDADAPLIALFSGAEEAAYGGASLTNQQMQDYFITLKTELEKLL